VAVHVRGHSRPSVSDDNPFIESLFKTIKSRPQHPLKPLANIEGARALAHRLLTWYNTDHRHSQVRYVTPQERHKGRDVAILAQRKQVCGRPPTPPTTLVSRHQKLVPNRTGHPQPTSGRTGAITKALNKNKGHDDQATSSLTGSVLRGKWRIRLTDLSGGQLGYQSRPLLLKAGCPVCWL